MNTSKNIRELMAQALREIATVAAERDALRVKLEAIRTESGVRDKLHRLEETRRLLGELTSLVRGECPSLLNEDSGGNSALSIAIDAATNFE